MSHANHVAGAPILTDEIGRAGTFTPPRRSLPLHIRGFEREQRIDPELFRSIPAELMFRFNFVPSNLAKIASWLSPWPIPPGLLSDELPLLWARSSCCKVATPTQISDLLKRTEQSQRVLEQATEAFTLQVVAEERRRRRHDFRRPPHAVTSAVSPVVRLVDTVIFTALERRASDIHIEARDIEVVVKYRIDGVLRSRHVADLQGMAFHDSFRIKVMSELDIAERRVPQDGRFRVRYKRPLRGFPRLHHAFAFTAKTPFSACSTRKRSPRNFTISASTSSVSIRRRFAQNSPLHSRALRHGARHRPNRLRQNHHALRRDQRN